MAGRSSPNLMRPTGADRPALRPARAGRYSRASTACPAARTAGPPVLGEAEALAKPEPEMPDDAGTGAAAREVGTHLREARLALGRERGDLARDLRIRETWLIAIEEGRLDDLPGAPFRTGFVRSYADRLGLDGAALAARLRPAPAAAGRRGLFSRDGGWRVPGRRVLAVVAMLAAAAVGGWYLSTGVDAVSGREEAAPGGGEGRGADGAPLAPAPSMPEPRLPPEAGAIPPAGTVFPAPAAADGAARPLAGPARSTAPGPRAPERVREVQRALARLGYAPGPVDGLMGPRTRSAIRAYQAAAGLTADGRLTPELERGIRADTAASGL